MPASRAFLNQKILGVGIVTVGGRFFPRSTDPVVNADNLGSGWTVSRSSAGVYLIQFADVYVDLISAVATPQDGTGGDWTALFSTYNSTASTLQLRTRHLGTLEDLGTVGAKDPNESVSFICHFKNSSVRF